MAFDPSDYCSNPKCGGTADACGCPADHNTQDKMRCPDCKGEWWRAHGDKSTVCLHPECRQEGSVVVRAAKYPPTYGEDGEPLDSDSPASGEPADCGAVGPDDECGMCDGCRESAAADIETQHETGELTYGEAVAAHELNGTWN
ncbi:hypothetical protein [Streptomyces sp. STR69]|uniref:hypothetical protein n=1 Tax=Streptomyces sp. STR69 TaxID=1796942 RepID=UPI0021C835B1|nr:hypothetical protein [Streptomyces sp. STR69]